MLNLSILRLYWTILFYSYISARNEIYAITKIILDGPAVHWPIPAQRGSRVRYRAIGSGAAPSVGCVAGNGLSAQGTRQAWVAWPVTGCRLKGRAKRGRVAGNGSRTVYFYKGGRSHIARIVASALQQTCIFKTSYLLSYLEDAAAVRPPF